MQKETEAARLVAAQRVGRGPAKARQEEAKALGILVFILRNNSI